MKRNLYIPLFVFLLIATLGCKQNKPSKKKVQPESPKGVQVGFDHDDQSKKVHITLDGLPFTSYVYDGQTPKPILFPIRSKSGKTLTRGFPFEPRENERVDHPHHAGLWFNYGDVNGIDFWNNSYAIPDGDKPKFGTIVHDSFVEIDSLNGQLKIAAFWRTHDGTDLLEETTTFQFGERGNTRIIDRTSTLKALQAVSLKDNKEGMLGIRVARGLELPSDEPAIFTDSQGIETQVEATNNQGVHGNYHSSSGLSGSAVWGTRNNWVKLEGKIEGETVSVTILDHKDNVGYPTYWHARGYGLFAANPLGQSVFFQRKGKPEFPTRCHPIGYL